MKAEEAQAQQMISTNPSRVYKLFAAVISILFFLTANALCVQAQEETTQREALASSSPPPRQNVSDEDSYSLEKGMNEFGLWGGGSFHAPTLIGTTEDSKFFTVGLRYGRVFATSKRVAYEYTIDAVPLAVVSVPRFIVRQTEPGLFTVRKIHRRIYGAGISPIGFKANFRRQSRVQPFAGISGGFLYFREPVPVREATQFNFTFDFGGGVQILTRSRRAFTLGYKYQHISNANRNPVNPGLDANVFYAGFSIFK